MTTQNDTPRTDTPRTDAEMWESVGLSEPTPRTDSVMVPTLHNLRVNLIFRIESAIDNDESFEIKRTDSIGNFLERDAPACLLAEAFLANHYPELLTK